MTADRDHYSYTYYADPANARTFDERRFGGPIGDLVATTQAKVLTNFIGRIQGRSILDVGTGTGRAAILLARGGAKVVGVDASAQMLDLARQRAAAEGASVTFALGDAHRLEYPARSFEVAVSLRVLMHTPRWRDCVLELCRVADRLVVLDYPSGRSFARLQSSSRGLLHKFGRAAEPYRVLSDGDVAEALKAGGFEVRAVHRLFVLPIALHKAVNSRRFTAAAESLLDRAGLLKRFGSPVTLVAERCKRS